MFVLVLVLVLACSAYLRYLFAFRARSFFIGGKYSVGISILSCTKKKRRLNVSIKNNVGEKKGKEEKRKEKERKGK